LGREASLDTSAVFDCFEGESVLAAQASDFRDSLIAVARDLARCTPRRYSPGSASSHVAQPLSENRIILDFGERHQSVEVNLFDCQLDGTLIFAFLKRLERKVALLPSLLRANQSRTSAGDNVRRG
jgi:hypothetical protein